MLYWIWAVSVGFRDLLVKILHLLLENYENISDFVYGFLLSKSQLLVTLTLVGSACLRKLRKLLIEESSRYINFCSTNLAM